MQDNIFRGNGCNTIRRVCRPVSGGITNILGIVPNKMVNKSSLGTSTNGSGPVFLYILDITSEGSEGFTKVSNVRDMTEGGMDSVKS